MKGERGEQGGRGDQGERGVQGEQGVIGPDGQRGIQGEPGRDGQPGRDGLHGLQGERGEAGLHGRDGKDGIDGKDGAGFENWYASYDGERNFTIGCGSGDRKKESSFVLPIPIDRGRWKAGESYCRGDEVTHAGNIYRAMRDTNGKPSEDDAWRVSVNKGRDGRDGKNGEQGPQGPEGRAGRDLTQLGPDGKKW